MVRRAFSLLTGDVERYHETATDFSVALPDQG
jgi:hypothetical protein